MTDVSQDLDPNDIPSGHPPGLYMMFFAELWERFASPPVRNAGTLGGNVANGSPIGDSMPAKVGSAIRCMSLSLADGDGASGAAENGRN